MKNSTNTQPKEILHRVYQILFWLILLTGISLRFYQHLMGRSLWEDEAHIALNFMKFGYIGLMAPLENYQTAPIFFLWSVETFCKIFGPSEVSLRTFPFIVSLLTMPLFYFMVKRLTGNTLTALISFLLFAVNISMIHYASEVKSYTIDVSVYILIVYLLLTDNPFVKKNNPLLLSIAGSLSIVYSNASVVVLFCAALYMIATGWSKSLSENKKTLIVGIPSSQIMVFSSWLIVWLVNYFRFIHNHPYGEGMKQIWSWTFCPTDIFSKEFSEFIKARIDDTIYTEMLLFTDKYYFPQILTALVIFSIVYNVYKKNWTLLLFTILPIVLHLIMSMFKMYPFFFRFILYLLPPFIILVVSGLSAIIQLMPKKLAAVLTVPVCLLFSYCCLSKSVEGFPFWDREIKPVISYINKNYPDKTIVVTTPLTLYTYYMDRGIAHNKNLIPIKWGLKPEEYYVNEVVKPIHNTYLLLYSVDGFADGYKEVLNSLKAKGLIIKQFEYKTYGVAEVRPLVQ
ncbi:hypothetical protein CAP35_05605 [Chitinophagaceae bacterium IBVUCB1]|nr:hypothetical protein CAP35_05605 [Chitinophagaceae bacterium IBVUCB1]